MDRSSILRASTNSYRQVEKCFYLLFYYLQIPRRIELYAGRGRKENASAFLARGRGRRQAAEAGAYLRSKYADSPRKLSTQNGCDVYRISAGQVPHQRIPRTAENRTLCRARALGKRYGNAGWDALPNGGPGGKRVPESALRLGRSFRMMPQAETATRNRAVEWDMLSQWQLKRKVHPGILVRNGMQFPNEWLAESSSRNPRSERDALSQRRSKRKAHPGISPQTGTHFPLHLPP